MITPVKGSDGPERIPEGAKRGPRRVKRAMISGLVKPNSLLATPDQEAVFEQMVAGAGFEPATFGL